jgi:hypothetical protein
MMRAFVLPNLCHSPWLAFKANMADYQSVEALVADANGIFGPDGDERNDAIREKIRADLRLLVAAAEDMLGITADVGEGDDPDQDGAEA